jgi:mRNA-degrading endonuclease HigB of HigAB toxin-antitoxin module
LYNVLHRHLNHQRFTLAAIDDVISRGRWQDWADLRQAVLSDNDLLNQVERVCRPYVSL